MIDGSGQDNPGETALAASQPKRDPSADLYGRFRQELVAFVRRSFGNGPPEPEDLVQQAYANFAVAASTQTVLNPQAFLRRTAHNLGLNAYKRQRRERRYFERTPDPKETCEARTDWDPEVVLLNREQYALVEDAVRAMPLRRRQLLLLNRIEGLSYAEIGRRMGVSESMVRKQVAQAVRECGQALLAADRTGRPGNDR